MIQVTAIDADDATYGNSAKVVYSILQGQPYFSVDPETGQFGPSELIFLLFGCDLRRSDQKNPKELQR